MRITTGRFATTTTVTICLLLAASFAAAGHYYEAVTSHQMEDAKGPDTMTVKAWVDGDNARIEFVTSEKKGWMANGNYLVTTDAGENVYLVDPKEETYARFSFEEMMATLGQAMSMMEQMGGMMKLEFTDVSTEKLLEEPGGSILGHPTTHLRYQTSYTMVMNMMGIKQQNRTEMIQDLWMTDELEARGFGVWLRPDRGLQTGNEGLDELMDQEMSKVTGFPLKTSTRSTVTNKKGESQTSSSLTEVTVLREESIDGDVFSWPPSYTETQLLPDMESAQAADQQGDEGSKKKKKRGLKGLFGGG
jgi:hypothetical protein